MSKLLMFVKTGNIVRLLWEKYGGCFDDDGNTPLHLALHSTSTQKLALQILSTSPLLCTICNNRGESPLFLAVRSGCDEAVHRIIKIEEPHFNMLRRNDGSTVLHSLSSCSDTFILNAEKTVRMLLEKFWWIIDLQDVQGNTALDYAKQENAPWLLNLLTNPSLIQKQGFDWIEAWNREENDAVITFARNCDDLRPFFIKNDTPLHHAKLATYKDYINFLQIPSIAELKNTTDHDGATPLHRALQRQDINFAKALLIDDRVKRMIRNHAGTTSMDLLAKLCKVNKDWEKMCKEIKVNPYLRTTYILPGTNMEQMRTTLSVIAALLATITFAAGFTLPGGINSDNGQALLGKKAAFLVFLLADAYAMCTSMLVLFCLVWSMVSEPDMACLLVDRSVFILMQSLYATLLVFMTGIYVVIEHTSLWAAIVIFVMCSIIGITANRTILHKVIAMLVPAAYREKLDQMRLLEEVRKYCRNIYFNFLIA
ncbi:protein ACCELERATED CELL DEATH 6-like [Silene latifolia]|uniref:protein ACCELERATED CELL DEATH 6-like n=1 Tax=Silene latifolia TaxID=37657 RepID=UPI003D770793